MSRKNEIIQFAKGLRNTYHTRDPFVIAKLFGIVVVNRPHDLKTFTAHTIKASNYPTMIAVNGAFSQAAQTVLCAHELGHALLHDDGINSFGTTEKNAFTEVEYEANLFAVAFLWDESEFNIPLSSMENYTLKSILDCNIEQL